MRANPYRFFFPLGLALGLWGVALWPAFNFGWLSFYPGALHAETMMGGFLFCFAAGFLMTAVPRFTGGAHATGSELAAQGALSTVLLAAALLNRPLLFHAFSVAAFGALIAFAARRFLRRKYDPPAPFVFVGLGLALGLCGSALLFAGQLTPLPAPLAVFGRLVYLHGMSLSLVLGIGSRLIPAILGWASLPSVRFGNLNEQSAPFLGTVPPYIWFNVTMVLVSFVIEAFYDASVGRLLRAAACSWIALAAWKIQKRPRDRTRLSWGLWLSCWFLLAGVWGYALWPAHAVTYMHLAFAGGFGQMTLMVASRVIISHGNHEDRLEERSRALRLATIFVLAAAVTRAAAEVAPSIYQSHLTYAAACWVVGLLAWGWTFVPRTIKPRTSRTR